MDKTQMCVNFHMFTIKAGKLLFYFDESEIVFTLQKESEKRKEI